MLRKESKYIRPKSISYIEKRILMKRNDTKVRAKRYETWGEIAWPLWRETTQKSGRNVMRLGAK